MEKTKEGTVKWEPKFRSVNIGKNHTVKWKLIRQINATLLLAEFIFNQLDYEIIILNYCSKMNSQPNKKDIGIEDLLDEADQDQKAQG